MSDQEYRFNLRFACAWRVVAELFRRHRPALDLRVNHRHPGLSAGGELLVTEGPWLREHEPPSRLSLSVHCGGGSTTGVLDVQRALTGAPVGSAQPAGGEAAPVLNVLNALVRTDDPKRVIDEVEARAGLPPVEHLPPMDRPAFVARVIAGFMEHRAFSRMGWRPSCGWYDASVGCGVSDWIEAFPEEWRALKGDVTSESQYAQSRGASRFWLLSRVGQNPEPRRNVSEKDGPAMVLDMATGRASLVGIGKPPFDLWGYHVAQGHSVLAAVRWVEDRVQVDR